MTLRAIVVDDSIVFRKAVRDALGDIDGVDVIDVAKDGITAVEKIKQHRPDVVTLDVEMPGLNGLEVLETLQRENIHPKIIMVSSHTQRGAITTTRALAMGAFDFILKPDHQDSDQNRIELRDQLAARLDSISLKSNPTTSGSTGLTQSYQPIPSPVATGRRNATLGGPIDAICICIGISTGGPKALAQVIPSLHDNLQVPILIVQHMPPLFTKTMADTLNSSSALTVTEASDGMPLKGGQVYIAPGGKQMRIAGYPGAWTAEITNDAPLRNCKPSVDYLFESAAKEFRDRLLAIVMTGMGDDGLEGCRAVAKTGGKIWAQDEATSTVFGMPRQIIEAQLANEVLSLDSITRGIAKCGFQVPVAVR